MANEVWMRHQEWLDRRQQKAGFGYDDQCDGALLIVDREGSMWTIACDTCSFEGGLSAQEVSPRHRVAMRSEAAGFPAMFAGREFENTAANDLVKAAIREWVARFERGALPAPAIWGLNGRGKSHLLVATCEQLLARYDVSVRFWPIAALLDELQDAFGDNQRHRRVWHDATTCDVLALDDVGAEQVTDWRSERLARLVDERYSNELPILVATNYPPVAWERTLGARTVSRLLGMTFPLELRGDDRRLVAAA